MMFTGIVEEVGTVREARESGGDLRVRIEAGAVLEGLRTGDSVAVGGCCLTVVAHGGGAFEVELSRETVAKTAPRWHAGAHVNLERAVRVGDRLGGHLVSGHVEATGRVTGIDVQPGAHVLVVRAPDALARYLIPQGSITVDGVSLTVVDVGGPAGSSRELAASDFTLWLIPHTLEVTTLGDLAVGDLVNLEADLVAKHLERLVSMSDGGLDAAALSRLGQGAVDMPGPTPPDPVPPPPPPGEPPLPEPPAPPEPPPVPEPPRRAGEAASGGERGGRPDGGAAGRDAAP
jgi:riboflavin synthase